MVIFFQAIWSIETILKKHSNFGSLTRFFSLKTIFRIQFFKNPTSFSQPNILFSNESACDFGPSGEPIMISSSFVGVLILGNIFKGMVKLSDLKHFLSPKNLYHHRFIWGYQTANAYFSKTYNIHVFHPFDVPCDTSVKLADIHSSLHPFTILKNTKADFREERSFNYNSQLFSPSFLLLEIGKCSFLHRNGSINIISNYHPTSLLSNVSLVIERKSISFLYKSLHTDFRLQQFRIPSKKSSVLQLVEFIKNIHRQKILLFYIHLLLKKCVETHLMIGSHRRGKPGM